MISLAGRNGVSARVWLPRWGVPWAEVTLDTEATISGRVSLQIADLSVACTPISGGGSKGRSEYRLAAGRGGWGKVIAPKSWSNDALVKASTVLSDAATAAGEDLDLSTIDSAARVGPGWARDEGPASAQLERIFPAGWYVGEDGITRVGTRPTRTLDAAIPRVTPVDRARRTVTLAPTSLAGLVPGIVVDGLEAADVEIVANDKGLRVTIYGKRSSKLGMLEQLLEQLDPLRRFRGVWEYRVTGREGTTLNLSPVRVASGMPTLRRARIRPGLPGCYGEVPVGSRVLVGFVDADPGRYYVAAYEEPSSADTYVPAVLELADGDDFVALASKVDTLFDALKNAPLTGTAADGEALQGALVAASTTIGGSVAAEKVKAA